MFVARRSVRNWNVWNTKYNDFVCSVAGDDDDDDDDDDGDYENISSVTMAVLSGPTLRLGD